MIPNSYAYTYIKIDLLKSLIIDDLSLQKLKNLNDLEQFIELISPYYPDIKIKEYSIVEIEQTLYQTFFKSIGRILHNSPENMRRFF